MYNTQTLDVWHIHTLWGGAVAGVLNPLWVVGDANHKH